MKAKQVSILVCVEYSTLCLIMCDNLYEGCGVCEVII